MKKENPRSNNIQKQEYKVEDACAARKCPNNPTSILKVRYINKTGHFCQKCASKLLQLELAEEIPTGGILNA